MKRLLDQLVFIWEDWKGISETKIIATLADDQRITILLEKQPIGTNKEKKEYFWRKTQAIKKPTQIDLRVKTK